MSEYSDQYPRRRKRHKGKYLELIYAFIANIVPHARLSPIGHTSFLCMKLDSIDISYFLFTIRPKESGNLETFYRLSILASVSTNDRDTRKKLPPPFCPSPIIER